jgi:serine/threonine protein kinase
VKAWQGQGAYGAVYRAVRVGWRRSEPVALKVALLPWDGRLAREAELLSRLRHPSIPRLLDRGGLKPSSGAEYPFIVMEWVEGTLLYAWAEQHAPSGKQVCRVLAQVARALEAIHAAGAVHRDVKGDNVLVRRSDRLPVLVDFGSCHFAGAARLTWQSLPPVTLAYLSPQAGLFYLGLLHHPDSYYPPSPADDLYALGVTAYRLVMGQYPPPWEARKDEQGFWRVTSPNVRPLLESNPRVEPELREVIVRLLSEAPEARGTAAQVVEALEAAANESEPQRPGEPQPGAEVSPPDVPTPERGSERPPRAMPPAREWAWEPWLVLAGAGAIAVLLVVLLWHSQPVSVPPGSMFVNAPGTSDTQAPDAGTAALGETSPTKPQASTPPSTEKKPLAQEPLPEPRPGQARPDKKGRCPGRKQVPINGGCWVDVSSSMDAQACAENGYVLFQGKCFVPANAPPKKPQPTSSPPEAR